MLNFPLKTKLQHTNQKLFWHNFKNFNDAKFDFWNTEWNTILEADKKDIDMSFKKFISGFNCLLQQHEPLKKLLNRDIKTLEKPWKGNQSIKRIKYIGNISEQKMLPKKRNCTSSLKHLEPP